MKNLQEITEFTDQIRAKNGYKDPFAFAIARVQKGALGKTIAASCAVVNFKSSFVSAAVLVWALEQSGISVDFSGSEFVAPLPKSAVKSALEIFSCLIDDARNHQNVANLLAINELDGDDEFVITFLFADEAPKSVESVYLKLYLLSLNKVAVREINLDGAFGIMPNLAWDESGKAWELDYLRQNEIRLKMSGQYPNIVSVDKFPRFLSHIIPADNTRILDTAKVRLGARLADGTVVMPGASYVNFNAGTMGAVMIEGRVSSSVKVGAGSDIGGGASILGVLSGTNGNPVSIGEKCLLGANSVTGVPLGDGCIIDAGIAVLEGTKVYISDKDREKLAMINPRFDFSKDTYKAKELSGLNGLHYRQNSQNGQMIVAFSQRAIKLNENLH